MISSSGLALKLFALTTRPVPTPIPGAERSLSTASTLDTIRITPQLLCRSVARTGRLGVLIPEKPGSGAPDKVGSFTHPGARLCPMFVISHIRFTWLRQVRTAVSREEGDLRPFASAAGFEFAFSGLPRPQGFV